MCVIGRKIVMEGVGENNRTSIMGREIKMGVACWESHEWGWLRL